MLRYFHPLISAGRRVWLRRRPDGFTLLLAGLGLLGAALVLAREVNYGVGLGGDAVNYISVARSLRDGNGFTQFDGSPLQGWGPLYPLLLAVASVGVFDPWAVAGPLNAGLFGLTVFVVGLYLRTQLESRLLTGWCCLALALAWPLLETAQFAMSEPLFILFSTLALMQAGRLLNRGDNAALLWAGAFTALAGLTRYAGIALPAAVVFAMTLQRGIALPAKARRIVIYGLIALTPLALWLLRNLLLVGSPTGGARNYHTPASFEAMSLLYQAPGIVVSWLFPAPPTGYFALPERAAVALGVILLALLAAGGVVAVRSSVAAHRAPLLFTWFAALYLTMLAVAIVTRSVIEIDFTVRYSAPLYLPVLLAAALLLDRVLTYASGRYWRWAGCALAAVLCLFLIYQVAINARAIRLANAGIGPPWVYHTPVWADSAALAYLRAELTTGTVFSNEIWPAYIYSNASTRHAALDCNRESIQQRMSAASADGAVYLLWFYIAPVRCGAEPGYYGGLDPLLAAVPLEPVAAFDDGVLLRYRPAADGTQSGTGADVHRDLRQRYAAIAEGVPAAVSDSGFSLYLDDAAAPRWATYINDQCAPDATQIPIYLRIVPVNRIYLTQGERPHGVSAYSFEFDRDGVRIGNQCMVSARLPNYAISNISTGQYDPDAGVLWEVEYEPGRAERLRAQYAAVANHPPVSQAGDFAVYHHDGRLIYVKTPCAPADTAAPFFLLITPTFADDLPADIRQHGIDNRGFGFYQAGALLDGRQCVASVALPNYPIAAIHTGQNVPGWDGVLWELWYEPDRPGRLRAELAAARQSSPPVIQSDFTVYRNDGRLIYAKAPCAPTDTNAPFFLHIVPTNPDDLPESGRPHGFDNRDFAFEEAGALLDGRQCIASVALPDYDIAAIRTGQYVPDAGRIWAAEFAPAGR